MTDTPTLYKHNDGILHGTISAVQDGKETTPTIYHKEHFRGENHWFDPAGKQVAQPPEGSIYYTEDKPAEGKKYFTVGKGGEAVPVAMHTDKGGTLGWRDAENNPVASPEKAVADAKTAQLDAKGKAFEDAKKGADKIEADRAAAAAKAVDPKDKAVENAHLHQPLTHERKQFLQAELGSVTGEQVPHNGNLTDAATGHAWTKFADGYNADPANKDKPKLDNKKIDDAGQDALTRAYQDKHNKAHPKDTQLVIDGDLGEKTRAALKQDDPALAHTIMEAHRHTAIHEAARDAVHGVAHRVIQNHPAGGFVDGSAPNATPVAHDMDASAGTRRV